MEVLAANRIENRRDGAELFYFTFHLEVGKKHLYIGNTVLVLITNNHLG